MAGVKGKSGRPRLGAQSYHVTLDKETAERVEKIATDRDWSNSKAIANLTKLGLKTGKL